MSNREMITELFKAIDNMDAIRFTYFLTEDITFRFGNAPAVDGSNAVLKYVAGFFEAINSLSHTIDTYTESGEYIFFRGEVTYTRKDLSTLTVPYANYFRIENGKIKYYQIYGDNSELF